MNESYVTVVGYVAGDPVLRQTKNGRPFATFRVGSTARRFDPVSRGFVDAGTNFLSVVTFNALAANVVASIGKGQPVVVHGRLRINTWVAKDGRSMVSAEIDAHSVGHDLAHGQSLFSKPPRAQFAPNDRLGAPEVQASLAELEEPEYDEFMAGAMGSGEAPGEGPMGGADPGDPLAAGESGSVDEPATVYPGPGLRPFDLATADPETDEYLAKVG